jgi:hypothetical protein
MKPVSHQHRPPGKSISDAIVAPNAMQDILCDLLGLPGMRAERWTTLCNHTLCEQLSRGKKSFFMLHDLTEPSQIVQETKRKAGLKDKMLFLEIEFL